jgi:aryl-alcohol dehydrogenase-like predicted oxidoreductase
MSPSYHLDGYVIGYGYIKEEAIKTIQKALDLGITLFDTADVYGCGRSECILGKVLGH